MTKTNFFFLATACAGIVENCRSWSMSCNSESCFGSFYLFLVFKSAKYFLRTHPQASSQNVSNLNTAPHSLTPRRATQNLSVAMSAVKLLPKISPQLCHQIQIWDKMTECMGWK